MLPFPGENTTTPETVQAPDVEPSAEPVQPVEPPATTPPPAQESAPAPAPAPELPPGVTEWLRQHGYDPAVPAESTGA